MEMLAAITALLNIVDLGFKIHERVSFKDNTALSDLLKEIGVVINEVANELEQGNYPHGRCAQLEQYLHSVEIIFTSGKLREVEQEKLHTSLIDAVRIEALLGQLNGLTESQKSFNINMLRSISGSYLALSHLVKV